MRKFLWVEEYRPTKINDCILPQYLKTTFQEFVDAGEFPNLLLSGSSGVGKTTVARALCDELGVSSIVINGSDEGRYLDTVRTKVKNFASTISLSGSKHKCVIIDEADNMTVDVLLRIIRTTVDLSLLVTTRIRSFNRCSLGVLSLTLLSRRRIS